MAKHFCENKNQYYLYFALTIALTLRLFHLNYGGLLVFSPLFVLAKLGFVNKSIVKQRFISFFLKGKTKVELSTLSIAYLQRVLSKGILRRSALSSISESKKQGKVYIVSASLDIWLNVISEHLGVGLICTKANYKNDVFDGKFSTPNCNRDEKPKRVARELLLDTYGQISYFGDSKGDFAMKAIATTLDESASASTPIV